MNIRPILRAAAAAFLTSACSDGAPKCSPITLTTASTSGDTVTTTSGLRYIETGSGTGTGAVSCKGVSINYDAFLVDGTLWDTSTDLGAPYSFVPGLNQVLIAGLEQGVVGMQPGSSRRLLVPPALGFGNNLIRFGTRKVLIPPQSTLIFDVTMVSIVP